MKQSILDLINISTYAGDRVDYTQGGGGNTSVKCDNGLMLIKASGFRLIDITENTGFVAVDCQKIKDYYSSVDLSVQKDYEKESAEVSKGSVVALEGLPVLRPSVEVGFHAILKKYVVHTHSVYANLITCAVKGESLAEKIFEGADYGYIFLPYINPGFTLTLKMKDAIKSYQEKTGKYRLDQFRSRRSGGSHSGHDHSATLCGGQSRQRSRLSQVHLAVPVRPDGR